MKTYKIITDAAVKKSFRAYSGRAGVLILDDDDKVLEYQSIPLGNVTSNEGEYEAIHKGVELLLELLPSSVLAETKIKFDSSK